MKVAILGTSMPALIAAKAVTDFDPNAELVLYGIKQKPHAVGARWYETPIPGLQDVESSLMNVESAGDPDTYIEKVGGPVSDYLRARASFTAFNYHGTNSRLWEEFERNIIQLEPDQDLINDSSWSDCNYVFNTVPRPIFFPRSEHHMFGATRHWRLDEELNGESFPMRGAARAENRNLMVFDGTKDSSWFRITQAFDLISVEWGFHKKPPIAGAYVEILPLGVPKEAELPKIERAWRGTTALAHLGAVAQWRPSTDVAEVYSQAKHVLEGVWETKKDSSDDDDRRGYL